MTVLVNVLAGIGGLVGLGVILAAISGAILAVKTRDLDALHAALAAAHRKARAA